MAKKKLLTTERQVRFARAFLAAIGGNQNNGYLLLAVIAWLKLDKDVKQFFGWNDYKAGAAALARVLLFNPRAKQKGYRSVVRALRQRPGKNKMVDQAKSFLIALAMSKFAKSHYGAADGNEITNALIKKWTTLTGGKALPDAWFVDVTVTKVTKKRRTVPPPPRQPRSLIHVLPKPDYLQPYAARSFYESRPHLGMFILPNERW